MCVNLSLDPRLVVKALAKCRGQDWQALHNIACVMDQG